MIIKFLDNRSVHFRLYIYNNIKKFIYGFIVREKNIILYVKAKNMLLILTFLKFDALILLKSLLDIAVIDYPKSIKGRFILNYIFLNYVYEYRISIKVIIDGFNPIYSINKLYSSSIWLEREAWDLFGIKFLFNSSLRRILTDYGFQGHPLRKDFPLIGYFDIFYDDSIQAISLSWVETSQILRFYKFENPWNQWNN